MLMMRAPSSSAEDVLREVSEPAGAWSSSPTHRTAACPLGDGPNVDIVMIGSFELRVRLAGPFVANQLKLAAARLHSVAALGFELIEVDAAEISSVDASGRNVLDDFQRQIGAAGARLEVFDPGHYLTMTTAA